MDFGTHLLVPMALGYCAAIWLRKRDLARGDAAGLVEVRFRRRCNFAIAVGVAAFAPDLDGLYSQIKRFGSLYALQHRGISHTVWGAPLHGLALLGALHLASRRWPARLGRFRFEPLHYAAVVLGGWFHLVMDAPTIGGVPALYPFVWERWIVPPFHWIVVYLFPVSMLVILLHGLRKLREEHVAAVGVAIVVVLFTLAGVRFHYMPEVPDGGSVHARNSFDEWIVIQPVVMTDGDGAEGSAVWHAALVGPNGIVDEGLFADQPERLPDDVAGRVTATNDHRGFRMGAIGPVVVQVVALEDQGGRLGWNVTYIDIPAHMDGRNAPRWTPADPFEDWGVLRFHMYDDGSYDVLQAGW